MMEENEEEKGNEPTQRKHRFSIDRILTITVATLGLILFLVGEWTDNVITEVAGSTFFLAFWLKWLIENNR